VGIFGGSINGTLGFDCVPSIMEAGKLTGLLFFIHTLEGVKKNFFFLKLATEISKLISVGDDTSKETFLTKYV